MFVKLICLLIVNGHGKKGVELAPYSRFSWVLCLGSEQAIN